MENILIDILALILSIILQYKVTYKACEDVLEHYINKDEQDF